jgi:AbrB family looped-hinge helix DNA binding protein
MEIAKVTSKGQVTIPLMIRNLLRIKTGDKIFFEEDDGKIYITNASLVTLSSVQSEMKGEAEKAGFESEDDVVAYIKELRSNK